MTMLQHGLVPSTGGYQIERSLRFNSADTANLDRTFSSSPTNAKIMTFSAWIKRCRPGDYDGIFSAANGVDQIRFQNSDSLHIELNNAAATVTTTQVFRDPSAWYHIVVAFDTTQSTASNRVKVYVNGSQVTAFSASTYPSQNYDLSLNGSTSQRIGIANNTVLPLSGYMADVYRIDGSALTPSSFGENDTDTGVWKPKAYTGSYGTNGFKLTFSDNSGTTATTLGKDTSGNGNNWTPTNFSVTAGAGNDSLVDTPTPYGTDTGAGGEVRGNYATLNPLQTGIDLSNGNLNFTNGAANESSYSTIGVSSGKWFCEAIFTSYTSTSILGIAREGSTTTSSYIGSNSGSYGWDANGNKYNNGSGSAYGSARSANDVIGCALDLDAGTVTFYLNGVSQGTAYSSLPAGTYFFGISSNSSTGNINFGQRPFAYTAPSGFKALCTTNLPTPTIGATSSTRADDYFNTVLWTGDGSSNRAITGVGFSPDFTWIKIRNQAFFHRLTDSVRGATKELYSNDTGAEFTQSQGLLSFDSDGFTVGTSTSYNGSSNTYVAWNWRGSDSSAVTNTAGSITSTVSANTTAGFSIVTYTGNATAGATVGHGLGVAPRMIIVKRRDASSNWAVGHTSIGWTHGLILNDTSAAATQATWWNDTAPTSTVFSLGTAVTTNTQFNPLVAYCFAPVAGYSAFGSYTGNGSTDGPMVYTGFRPAFVIVKGSSAGAVYDWYVKDSKRPAYNLSNLKLLANSSNAEDSGGVDMDFLSNGFKLRSSNVNGNSSGETFIYMAFAESPFKYALAR